MRSRLPTRRQAEIKTRIKTAVRSASEGSERGGRAAPRGGEAPDKAVSRGIIHKNQAANRKSSLMRRVNELQASTSGDAEADASAGPLGRRRLPSGNRTTPTAITACTAHRHQHVCPGIARQTSAPPRTGPARTGPAANRPRRERPATLALAGARGPGCPGSQAGQAGDQDVEDGFGGPGRLARRSTSASGQEMNARRMPSLPSLRAPNRALRPGNVLRPLAILTARPPEPRSVGRRHPAGAWRQLAVEDGQQPPGGAGRPTEQPWRASSAAAGIALIMHR